MVYIGIDISKSSFVAAYPSMNGYRTKTYPNTSTGVRKFIATLSVVEHHCVMEATGNYGFLLLYLLHQSGIAVSLVNPKQIKHFARMMMAVTKTDRERCLYDRHVWREDESSHLQNALAGYHSAQTEKDRNPSVA